jgi:hypothetical protein
MDCVTQVIWVAVCCCRVVLMPFAAVCCWLCCVLPAVLLCCLCAALCAAVCCVLCAVCCVLCAACVLPCALLYACVCAALCCPVLPCAALCCCMLRLCSCAAVCCVCIKFKNQPSRAHDPPPTCQAIGKSNPAGNSFVRSLDSSETDAHRIFEPQICDRAPDVSMYKKATCWVFFSCSLMCYDYV